MAEMTEAEFLAIGMERFGDDPMNFKFVCPSCGYVASAEDYKAAGAPETAVGFSCVGRWMKGDWSDNTFNNAGGPCEYAGGGLIKLNPIYLTDRKAYYFDFAQAAVPHTGEDAEKRRSNHFTDEDIDRGMFPRHISRDGRATYSERRISERRDSQGTRRISSCGCGEHYVCSGPHRRDPKNQDRRLANRRSAEKQG